MDLYTRLENRKGFKDLNITIDRGNKILMLELGEITSEYNILKSEAKIKRLALLISSHIYIDMAIRFDKIEALPSAPSRKRFELIYVDVHVANDKFRKSMDYKKKKRKYTLHQFFTKSEFIKQGLIKENINTQQQKELKDCFELFYYDNTAHVNQGELFILLDMVLSNDGLDYVERIKALRLLKNKQSSLEYKILRYGVTVGRNKFKEFVRHQQKCNSLNFYIDKFGIVLGDEIWNNLNQLRREKTIYNWSVEGFKHRFGNNWEVEYTIWTQKIGKNLLNTSTGSASKSSLKVFLPVRS